MGPFREDLECFNISQVFRGRGYDVKVNTLIMGTLGAWDSSNGSILRSCHVSHRYTKLMCCLLVYDTICWSHDIYMEHIMGHHQYSDPIRQTATGPDPGGTTCTRWTSL
ncbi:hypothetical protein Y1Q_0000639 [Alligator mississippiensis]|uniref:Uncharacterized protein n=1 Tax=Alligator mississippiensis TaxID=8496 RepID=A0A151MBX0_ALLMI|nr:hypothetical protein Y1Q_0000639 [Alligator mississippiensis]